MYICVNAAGNFSFLLLQEEPRVVANTGEQNKARSDKQKFRKDLFPKQEKRQVRRARTNIPGDFLFIVYLISQDSSYSY